MYYISVGDTFIEPVLTAYDHNGDVEVNMISNNLDIDILSGDTPYEIHYQATNDIGSTDYIIYVHVLEEQPDPDLTPYYSSAEGLIGNQLLLELRNIIYVPTTTSYDKAKEILELSDIDPNNSNNVLLVYNRASVQGQWSTDPLIWNREHVWPDSLLSGAFRGEPHNLKPANPTINNNRGNSKFASGSGGYGLVSGGWYPGDEDKGDIARIVFYMVTRYSQLSIATVGNLNMFIQWHNDDPVDNFERNRNDVIYSYSSNRNPYIDYPEFVQMIWGEGINNNFYNEFNTIANYLVNNYDILNTEYNNELYLEERKYF